MSCTSRQAQQRNAKGENMRDKLRSTCTARIALAAVVAVSSTIQAQDRRHVTEPVIPPRCATLHARLRYHNGRLDAPDDTPLDSPAVQKAIDNCTPGRSVRLEASGNNNAF